MPEIDQHTEILEDYEPLLELRAAYETRNRAAYDGILGELSKELADEYRAKIEEKVRRWASATVVLRFYDRPPARAYIQTKMLYRDGFYEATIMVSRSIAEMICYDRLDGAAHPFGTMQQVERKCFRDLIKWLAANDSRITTKGLRQSELAVRPGQQLRASEGQSERERRFVDGPALDR